jgi:hypothetical protein
MMMMMMMITPRDQTVANQVAWHVTARGGKKIHKVLIGDKALGIHRCAWQDNIKVD